MENNTYISILRGINVSGQKMIKMDALKLMVEILKFPFPSGHAWWGQNNFFLLNNI